MRDKQHSAASDQDIHCLLRPVNTSCSGMFDRMLRGNDGILKGAETGL